MRLRDFLGSSLPIIIAAISPLAIELAQHMGLSVREQFTLGVTILAMCLGLQWMLFTMREAGDRTARKQEVVQRILDAVVSRATRGGHPLDPLGDLNIRMNVMLPYRKRLFGVGYVIAYDRPARSRPRMDAVFHMYACSVNSKGRSSLWVGWRCGQGCVGKLWAQGEHIRAAPLPEGVDLSEYDMEPEQERHTRDTRCVVSVAIVQGIGLDLWRRGILNISSSNDDAIEAWSEDGEVRDEVAAYLVRLAQSIAEDSLLPKSSGRHRQYRDLGETQEE